jgi:lysophospholipase L1-like esterase
VDGEETAVLKTEPGLGQYTVKLPAGTHQVILHKRNDGNYGMAVFKGLQLPAGARLLPAPPRAARRIEFIGDSLSVGYGVEGPNKECQITRPHENNWKAFTQMTARALQADAHVTAISGKGVVRNYGEKTPTSPNPVPYYYARTLMRRGDVMWDFQSWVPDAIVLKLGTNDHSTEPHPSEAVFTRGLHDFISAIRDANGDKVPLFLVSDPSSAPNPERVKKVYQEQIARGAKALWFLEVARGSEEELGCHWHPKAVVHERMAAQLSALMKKELHW